jgi:cytoskeletal protein CcmA (bactofilin family)
MFGKDKDIPPGKDQLAPPPQVAETPRPMARQTVAAPAAQPERTSSISAGMAIFGKVVGDGDVKVFGRIEGELQAASVQICEGAQVEGNIVAELLTIGGRVKGTIHAARVKLQSTADVEGDIFHRSLAIEENARFEGSSRREEQLTHKPSSVQPKDPKSQTESQSRAVLEGNGKLYGSERLTPTAS